MTLELVALAAGMLRETPTASQTWDAKARVTRERRWLLVMNARNSGVLGGRNGLGKRRAWERGIEGLPCWSAAEQT